MLSPPGLTREDSPPHTSWLIQDATGFPERIWDAAKKKTVSDGD